MMLRALCCLAVALCLPICAFVFFEELTQPQDAQRAESRKVLRPGPVMTEPLRVAQIRTFTNPAPDPTPAEFFQRWATSSLRHLTERFEVPPPTWVVDLQAPSFDCTAARIYDPKLQQIRVYERWPNGVPLTMEQMMYVFMHGFLHHLHTVRGMTHLVGHDAEFDRWSKVLGLTPK